MPDPEISTCLWFDAQGEEAARFYCSLFDDSRITNIFYRDGDPALGALTVAFTLMGQRYLILNGGPHYKLSPAASISVYVDTQAEVDRLWDALLSDGGSPSRCAWLTDRYGLSWQIIPRALLSYLKSDPTGAVMQAMMGMAKIDIAALDVAAKG